MVSNLLFIVTAIISSAVCTTKTTGLVHYQQLHVVFFYLSNNHGTTGNMHNTEV